MEASYYISPAVKARQAIERRIVRSFLREVLQAGFEVGIDNGGDSLEIRSTDFGKLAAEIMATDEDRIFIFDGENQIAFGWAYFVYGNDGWDVLSDYTLAIEKYIPKTLELIDRLSA